MKRAFTILPIAILTVLFVSCSDKKKPGVNEAALEINNRALDLFVRNQQNPDSVNRAVRLMDSAIAMDPAHENFYYNKISILQSAGRIDEALDFTNGVVARFPNDPAVYYQRGTLYRRRYSPDSSKADLERSLQMMKDQNKPRTIDNDVMRIEIYKLLGDSSMVASSIQQFKTNYRDSERAKPFIAGFDTLMR